MKAYEFDEVIESEWLQNWLGDFGPIQVNARWEAWISQGPVYNDDRGGMGDTFHIEHLKVLDLYVGDKGIMNLYMQKPELQLEIDNLCEAKTWQKIGEGMQLDDPGDTHDE